MTEQKNKELVKEVQELLSQIVLKLKDVKELEIEANDDGYITVGGVEEIYDEEFGDYIENENMATEDEKYLFSVKTLCEKMSKSKGSGERILTKYYTSTC